MSKKGMTSLLCMIMACLMLLSGCGQSQNSTGSGTTQTAEVPGVKNSDTPEPPGPQTEAAAGETVCMTVKIMINDAEYTGSIPDTVCGRAFAEKLPFELNGSRAADDVCCSVSGDIDHEESENEPWSLGDFGWFGGWFTLLCDHEDKFNSMSVPVVCKINESDIPAATAVSGSVTIRIEAADQQGNTEMNGEETDMKTSDQIVLTIGHNKLTATLADNSSAEALKELLSQGPVTISMRDYGSMEKVGDLGTSLPTNDEQITTEAGDLILYMGSAFVIYYAPNSWNFTQLGKIDDITASELKEILGSGSVQVILSLPNE